MVRSIALKLLPSVILYVKDPPTPNMSKNDFVLNESDNPSDFQKEQANVNNNVSMLNEFCKMYDSFFTTSILDKLPPPRGVDNHRIYLIQGRFSPNKAPYCISIA